MLKQWKREEWLNTRLQRLCVYSVPNTGVTRDFHLSTLAHHADWSSFIQRRPHTWSGATLTESVSLLISVAHLFTRAANEGNWQTNASMLYTLIASIVYLSSYCYCLFVCLFVLHALYSVFYLHWAPCKVVHWTKWSTSIIIQYNIIQYNTICIQKQRVSVHSCTLKHTHAHTSPHWNEPFSSSELKLSPLQRNEVL